MPPVNWIGEPIDFIGPFETKHRAPAAGALFAWAAWAVDSLHYLDDIDRQYDSSHAAIGGHRPDVVDVAHARWATATSITALDLCAAGLGRAFCGHVKSKELDVVDFDPAANSSARRTGALRAKLPSPVVQWIDNVCADPQYRHLKAARDWLTHSRVRRHFTLATTGPPQRLQLELDSRKLDVRSLIEEARDVGVRHVADLLRMLPIL